MTSTPQASQRAELFDQLTSLMEASGQKVDEQMRADFEPLLNGEMTPAQHREFLMRKYGQ